MTEGRRDGNAAELSSATFAGGRRPDRPLRLRAPEPTEYSLHVQVAELLRKWAHPDCWWTTIPNQQDSGPARGAHLKRMGVRAGNPDMLFIHEGRLLGLELKRRVGVMSDAQVTSADLITRAGAEYRVARSLAEAIGILRAIGIITRELTT